MVDHYQRIKSSPAPSVVKKIVDDAIGLTSDEQRLFDALNRYRAQHGRSPLRIHPALMAAARGRTNARYPSGHWVNRQQPFAAARQAGFGGNGVGENLGWGNSPEGTVNPQWANSRGHNSNQLGNWRYVGVGVGHARVAMFGR